MPDGNNGCKNTKYYLRKQVVFIDFVKYLQKSNPYSYNL